MANTTVSDNSTNGTTTLAVEHVDPRDLLVDLNVRTDARLTKDFLASVRDLGVLVPIVAVRTTQGPLRVRFGQRRTLAAIEGNRPTVPVVIVGDEATDDTATIERLVTQYAENEHRTGLSLSERVEVASQLSLLGVSAAQITKRTKMPRAQVDAALAVAASDLATAAAARYDFLTLDQAATVAEFEDDDVTVKALVVAARNGRFDHLAQRARDQRTDNQRREQFITDLTNTGVRVVDPPSRQAGGTSRALYLLTDPDGQHLTVESHAQCPGHAAYVSTEWGYLDPATGEPVNDDDTDGEADDYGQGDDGQGEDADEATAWGQYLIAEYVCTDYAAHGHRAPTPSTYGTGRPKMADLPPPAEQEAARAQRRDVIESNKAWRSAETVRRDWLRTFLTRKTAPKGTAAFVAAALAKDASTLADVGGNHLAADLLGCEASGHGRSAALVDLVTKATEARAQVLTLAQVLGAYEDATHVGSWRTVSDGTRRYLEFIAANGYTLADVERRACGQDPLPDPLRTTDQPA